MLHRVFVMRMKQDVSSTARTVFLCPVLLTLACPIRAVTEQINFIKLSGRLKGVAGQQVNGLNKPKTRESSTIHCTCHHYSCRIISLSDRLGGLVVKASAWRAEDPGFESRLRRDFSGSSHISDFKIGTPVATLPGA